MDVREKIIERAVMLFRREGIRAVTMDYLANNIGVSKRTIYEQFRDKFDLLSCTIQNELQKRDDRMDQVVSESSNVLEILVEAFKVGSESLKNTNPVYIKDLEIYYPEIWNNIIVKKRQEDMVNFGKLLERGIKEGYFRSNLNIKLTAKIFQEQMAVMGRTDIFPPDEYPPTELFQTLFINFVRGICTVEGIKELEALLNR
ncbi:TetR/AcrR family transcriptional regulator [Marinilabiliaceae bacterium ANBcel2]|nr:TetR/AcrR family transcriptional regulator [Marinilabiliaceae bacterium ANBcel2]